jgi:hypothetical protein
MTAYGVQLTLSESRLSDGFAAESSHSGERGQTVGFDTKAAVRRARDIGRP